VVVLPALTSTVTTVTGTVLVGPTMVVGPTMAVGPTAVGHHTKGENTGSPDPHRDGFLAGYMGICQCLIFIPM